MGAYIVRRLVAMVLMLIALSMIVFLIFNALPADPARLTCGKSCSPQIIEANRHRLGLDKPLVNQYGDFVKGIFVGRTYGTGQAEFSCHVPCLGYSFRKGEQVTDLLKDRFPVTAQLAIGGVHPVDRRRGQRRHHRRAETREVAGPPDHGGVP